MLIAKAGCTHLDFLRGYVLEKLRRGEEVTYFYEKYMPMNRHLPAPNCFRIEGSPYQINIQFQEEISRFSSPSSITLSNKSLYIQFDKNFSEKIRTQRFSKLSN